MVKFFPYKRIRIPRPVALFFIRALLLFMVWKAVYLSFLLPKRILDEPLTHSVGIATSGLLNLFSHHQEFSAIKVPDRMEVDGVVFSGDVMDIYLDDKKTLRIADACNGLELLVLYAGFLICFPSPLAKKLLYTALGFSLIYLLNILRCAALVEIYLHYNKYLDFSHHFAFTFVVYAFIFLLWYFFTKNLRLNERPV